MKKIIVWGTGNVAQKFMERHGLVQEVNVLGFTDSNEKKWNTFFGGYRIVPPEFLLNQEYDYILILSSYYEEIKKNLLKRYAVSSDKILSTDEAYQMYAKIVYSAENKNKSNLQELLAGISFSEYMYERLSTGIDNMFSYLDIKDKYSNFIENLRTDFNYAVQDQTRILKEDTLIWVCWLQGLENAPDIVKCCINSIIANVKGKIHIITYDNYSEYVEINGYILEKHRLGIISKTHFSDIIRLALLCRYGGIWIDATVLVLDGGLPDYIYKLPIFMYKISDTLDNGYHDPRLFSNWLIKSEKADPVLSTVYKVIQKHWETEEEIPYFFFHYVMRLIWNIYMNESGGGKIGYKCRLNIYNTNCYMLFNVINEKFDEVLWDIIRKKQPIQKLIYKNSFKEKDSFYGHILKKYGKGI